MKRNSTGNWLIPLVILAIVLIVIATFIGPRRKRNTKEGESKNITEVLAVEKSVRVSGDQIYLNGKEVSLDELEEELKDYRGDVEIIDDQGDQELFQKAKKITDACRT